jgi:hypothetical protein
MSTMAVRTLLAPLRADEARIHAQPQHHAPDTGGQTHIRQRRRARVLERELRQPTANHAV